VRQGEKFDPRKYIKERLPNRELRKYRSEGWHIGNRPHHFQQFAGNIQYLLSYGINQRGSN
jgi:hypothetical protein